MAVVSKPYTFTVGAVIVAAEHNSNFDTIYNDYNGNIDNSNISAGANITDTKLASITTANKVNTDALTTSLKAQGDILYYNGTKYTRLGAGASGTLLQSGGAGANPSWRAGTKGDILYCDGTTWVSLGAGTSGNNLQTNGAGANPSWASGGASGMFAGGSVWDYGTTNTAYTAKTSGLKICYGSLIVPSSGTESAYSLPFTSNTTYVVTIAAIETNGATTVWEEITRDSGSKFTIANGNAANLELMWIAVGT